MKFPISASSTYLKTSEEARNTIHPRNEVREDIQCGRKHGKKNIGDKGEGYQYDLQRPDDDAEERDGEPCPGDAVDEAGDGCDGVDEDGGQA